MIDPQTPEQWQIAVDLAEFYLLVDSARVYGLIETNQQINVDRCQEILDRGRAKGITPSKDAPEKLTAKWVNAIKLEGKGAA
jgi:hypothetical protein